MDVTVARCVEMAVCVTQHAGTDNVDRRGRRVGDGLKDRLELTRVFFVLVVLELLTCRPLVLHRPVQIIDLTPR